MNDIAEKIRFRITQRGRRLPIIETPRLVLRDIQINDISNEYLTWLNDPDVTRYLEIRHVPQTEKIVREYIESKLENTFSTKHFGVYDNGGKRLVGTVTLPNINLYHSFADISFVIGHKEARHKGYATEAVHAVVHYMFSECGLYKLWAGYYDGNIASARVLEKNGFKVEGRIKNKLLDSSGKRVDHVIVGLTVEQYIAQNLAE